MNNNYLISPAPVPKEITDKIVEQFGPFFYKVSRKRHAMNHASVALYYVATFRLLYDVEAKTFLKKLPDNSYATLSQEGVIQAVSIMLHDGAQRVPWFPKGELRLPRIKALLEEMKIVAAFTRQPQPECQPVDPKAKLPSSGA